MLKTKESLRRLFQLPVYSSIHMTCACPSVSKILPSLSRVTLSPQLCTNCAQNPWGSYPHFKINVFSPSVYSAGSGLGPAEAPWHNYGLCTVKGMHSRGQEEIMVSFHEKNFRKTSFEFCLIFIEYMVCGPFTIKQ